MTIYHQSINIPVISIGGGLDVVYEKSPIVLSIGTFDGVHLGHQKLIQHSIKEARMLGCECGIYTFDPHPSFVTHCYAPKKMIISSEKKYELLRKFDICAVFVQTFDMLFSQQSPKIFLKGLVTRFPTLHGICVGEDFKFGKDRSGDIDIMRECALEYDILVNIVSPKLFKDERISSSRIRQSIASGNIDEAIEMLGHDL